MELLDVFKWSEGEVFEKFTEMIKEKPTLIDPKNYAFWGRNSPYIVQAHIDTVGNSKWKGGKWNNITKVWEDDPEELAKINKPPEILRIRNLVGRRNGVLGGDDRAGIMAIVYINNVCKKEKLPPPSILLTNGEESGGTGMGVFVKDVATGHKDILDQVRLVVALDRRGCSEYVHYSSTDMPKEVMYYVETFGFNKSHGSWSDSKKITSEFKIPHVNLSVGYYDNHSEHETVHIDETLLTAKRVCAMIKDPIDKRYEVNEYVYVKKEWPKYNNTNKENKNLPAVIQDVTKIAAVAKRRKRCEAMAKQSNLPFRCTYYPYLDYLLTDSLIRDGFHIVSTPGNGKTLEEWHRYFDVINGEDEIAKLWQRNYGAMKRVYVKATTARQYYLAVNIDKNYIIAYNAQLVEDEEELIFKKQDDEIKKSLKNIESNVEKKVDVEMEKEKGYCVRYSMGECSGDCHGCRENCNFPEGPNETEAGSYVENML